MWGCNWILFVHGWFCPIHLIGQKPVHFEKKLNCWQCKASIKTLHCIIFIVYYIIILATNGFRQCSNVFNVLTQTLGDLISEVCLFVSFLVKLFQHLIPTAKSAFVICCQKKWIFQSGRYNAIDIDLVIWRNIFKNMFGGHQFFLQGHWFPVLDFWWHLPWVCKPVWFPCLHVFLPSCNESLRFISSSTPADPLMASMAAEPF